MGNIYDAPNQQVVRADGSAPWEEGTGGSSETTGLNALTKAELLELAQSLGVSPANASMSKGDLIAGVEAAQSAPKEASGEEASG